MSKSIYGKSSVNLTIDNLSFLSITTNDITTTNASVTAVIDMNTANATTINTSNLNVSNLTIDEITVDTLNVSTANVSQINSSNVSTKNISVSNKLSTGSNINCSGGLIVDGTILSNTGMLINIPDSGLVLPALIDGGLQLTENANGLPALDINGTTNVSTLNSSQINASKIDIKGDGESTGIIQFYASENNILFGGVGGPYRISVTDGAGNFNIMNNIDDDNLAVSGNRYCTKYNSVTTSSVGRMSMVMSRLPTTAGENVSYQSGFNLDQSGKFNIVRNPNTTGGIGGGGAYTFIIDCSDGIIEKCSELNASNINASILTTTGVATIGGSLSCNGATTTLPLTFFKQAGIEGGQTNYEYQTQTGKYVNIDVFGNDNRLRIFDSDGNRNFSFYPGSKFSIDTNVSTHNINCSTGLITTLDTNTLNASNINCSVITADDYVIVNESVSTLNASEINVDTINISSLNVSSNISYAEITGCLKMIDIGFPSPYGLILDTTTSKDTNIAFYKNGDERFAFDCLNSGSQNGFRLQNKQPSLVEVQDVFLINGSGNDLGFHISDINDFIENCSTSFHNKVGFDDNIILQTAPSGSIYTDYKNYDGLAFPVIDKTYFRNGLNTDDNFVIQNSSTGNVSDLTDALTVLNTGEVKMENALYIEPTSQINFQGINVSGNSSTYFNVSVITAPTNKLLYIQNSPTGNTADLTPALAITNTTGDIVMENDLWVKGTINCSSNVSISSGMFVNGNVDIEGNVYATNYSMEMLGLLTVNGTILETLNVSYINCSNDLLVKGDIQVDNDILIKGNIKSTTNTINGNFNNFTLLKSIAPTYDWGQGNHIQRDAITNGLTYSHNQINFTYDATNHGFKLSNANRVGVYRIRAVVTYYNASSQRVCPYISIAVDDDTTGGINPSFNNYYDGQNPFSGGYVRFGEGKFITLNAERVVRLTTTSQLISINTYIALSTSPAINGLMPGGLLLYTNYYTSLTFEYLGNYEFTNTTF